jgi:uncharacterized RDD family membrane protein YckC
VEGRRVELAEGDATLGRSRKCEVPLKDPSISRHHARISVAAGKVQVTDLSSSNGTFLNGTRLVAAVEVLDGDRLTVGETEMVVRIHPPEPPAPASTGPAGPAPAPRTPGSAAPAPAAPAAARSPSPTAPTPQTPHPPGAPPTPALLPAIDDLPPLPPRASAAATRTRSPTSAATRSPARFLPPAGFWIRGAAYLVDNLWMAAAAAAAAYATGGPTSARGGLAGMIVAGGLGFLVPIAGWSRWGTTPGKRLLRLYVCTTDGAVGIGLGRALLRWVGYLLSAALFGLGFVMIGVTAAKRGLHDLVAGTYVGRR